MTLIMNIKAQSKISIYTFGYRPTDVILLVKFFVIPSGVGVGACGAATAVHRVWQALPEVAASST
jgi:hypothetical protein